jgi:hypothetical protein
MSDELQGSRGIAPADAVPHAPWPTWRKVLAYVLMAALSLASIWIVDLKVHRGAQMPMSHSAAR